MPSMIHPGDRVAAKRPMSIAPEWPWRRCPGCKQDAAAPLYKPALYFLEDEKMPSKWLLLYGWICQNTLHGTVVVRGPNSRQEHPNLLVQHGRAFRLTKTRKVMLWREILGDQLSL
jgi:hypothetical protein